ncbi:cysteine hydrolase [Endozoicomonas sp. G2_2]|uniref:cysteine hydrolase family protein n=1 Tax=Endozoicomonas sp. G2_2 TaxID=2821092 RepID=UPI001ADC540C|nr:cysteine hydrolase family protein [Endozoicomonas sp. G2_2]MBO9469017.1 cysteine hydrolase [Endozoicomonas sp. G2_2]
MADASPTLRAVSGLSDAPPALSESVLVLIDCQNTYREGVMQLVGVEPALQRAQRLLERARDAGISIVHVRHDAGPGSPYDLDTAAGQIADEVAPRDGEIVITKTHPNAFVNTDLHATLQSAGASQLVLGGFMTHMCVNSTARGAFNHGYAPTVVAAATATRDLARGAHLVRAADLHEASLASIADLFGVVVEDADDLGR